MGGWRRRCAAVLVAAAGLCAAPRAHAWCLFGDAPTAFARHWRASFPDLRIPVYIAVGPASSLLQTELGLDQAEAIVLRVIAAHNESVTIPTLYYAGTTEADLGPDHAQDLRPAGIVIDSFPCAQALADQSPCGTGQLACTAFGAGEVARARVTLRYGDQDCGGVDDLLWGRAWGLDTTYGIDASRVLLHEFGHALGLDHSDRESCSGRSDGGPAVGVMTTQLGSSSSYERDWRRDDLAGLREIYGADIRHTVYTWIDEAFPARPEEAQRRALCVDPRTPPALSSGVTEVQFLAYTDRDDRVAVVEWDGERFVAPPGGEIVDPSPLGVSYAAVAVAHSDGSATPRLLVVWSADDGRDTRGVRLRWAMRDLDGGEWSYGALQTRNGEMQRASDVAVAHDPGTGLFIVSTVDNDAHPSFLTLDADGVQHATSWFDHGTLSRPYDYEVGPVVCDGERCVISHTVAEHDPGDDADPHTLLLGAGWYMATIAADGALTPIADTRAPVTSVGGRLDLLASGERLRGVMGERRYSLGRPDAEGNTPPALRDPGDFAGADWPLRIGRQGPGEGEIRLAARRHGLRCGDGLVDCDERCDDANLVDGDGCSARCTVEAVPTDPSRPDVTTSDGEPEHSDTGDPGELAADGCECASDRGAPALFVLVLLLRRRRFLRK